MKFLISIVCLLFFISHNTSAQEFKVAKSCKGYYKPLVDMPDSVKAKGLEPKDAKIDQDAENGHSELLPITTLVQRIDGTHVYKVKVLTGLFKGRLLYVKKEFLKPV